jgi:sphingomyelin phosphodiesterase acid-like 3
LKHAILLLFVAAIGLAAAPRSQFAVISDIHFNPLANPALATQLMAADASQWEAIFANDAKPPAQKYLADSTWSLFSALVAGLQNVQPKPKLMLLTGDILAHKFRAQFEAAAGTKDAAAFRAFVKKTVQFVTLELEKAASGVPVVYTLGNNDGECGDYALEPNGPFLQDTLGSVETLAHADPGALAKWLDLGSYVTPNPVAAHHLIIALNTNFWSRRYANACAGKTDGSDPGEAVLAWLTNQLKDARQQGDKVWLIYHIPPGVDGHSSAHAKQAVTFWKQTYADGFYKLLDQYRNTIELNLAGHTHLDDMRLVVTDHAATLVLINPGVSPNVGQNPAFRVISLDSHARPQDIFTYYIPDLGALKWRLEYSADAAYHFKHIDARDYQALYRNREQTPALDQKWTLYYSVSRLAGLSDDKAYRRSLYCASGNVAADAYEACVKQAPQ